MNNKLKHQIAVSFLLISILVTGCSTEDIKQSDNQSNNEVNIETANSALTPQPTGSIINTSPVVDEETHSPIASLVEHDIYLYPTKNEDGVILKYKDVTQKMDWIYITPRLILPTLQLFDFDSDGNDELAVVLNIGSGTGISIDELHIVEISKLTSDNEQTFIDHKFDSNDYIKLVEDAMTFKKMYKNDILFAEIVIANHTYEVSLSELVEWFGEEKIEQHLVIGNIVYFELVENDILFTAAVGITIEDVFDPQYIGEIKAKVNYINDTFSLSDYSFVSHQ